MELRSAREIKKMRAAGLIVWQAHQAAARIIQPGITTSEINDVFRETFVTCGAEPLFLNYGGIPGTRPPFPAETCISINEQVVHGIPGKRKLETGDLVSLDTGCRIGGWCGDAAVTHAVGKINATQRKLLQVTRDVLSLAIELMNVRTRWSEVSREMQSYVEAAGFSVVEDMVGHAIGRNLHEPPQVPNYFSESWRAREDFDLRPGVVLAVEPMVNVGVKSLITRKDGWTVVTKDAKPSAHFEHTIAITSEGVVRLTGPPNDDELASMPIWLQDRSSWVLW